MKKSRITDTLYRHLTAIMAEGGVTEFRAAFKLKSGELVNVETISVLGVPSLADWGQRKCAAAAYETFEKKTLDGKTRIHFESWA